jgi:uncharacterized protein
MTESELFDYLRQNPVNVRLMESLADIDLPQCVLTAGCLFQAVWNLKSGNDAGHGVRDYDVFYFYDSDLSWQAEDTVIRGVRERLGSLAESVEIRNQARVHLWYPQKFGTPYPKLGKVEDGIDRFLVSCTRIGVQVKSGRLYAPDGLDDLWSGILRMNPLGSGPDLFMKKSQDYRTRWPWLSIISP